MPDRTPDELARYWDSLTMGSDPDTTALDPSLAQVLHRFEQSEEVPGPDPTFLANLMEDLMHTHVLAQPVPRDWSRSPSPAIHRPFRGRLNRPSLFLPAGPNRWFAILASAALLLLTLGIAGYAILDRDASSGPGGPAIQAPATPSPSAGDDGMLLEFPLPADVVPEDGFGAAGIRFYTMAPGIVAAWNGELSANNPGIWANYLLEGSMTMVADGPVEVVRAAGTREQAAAGTEIVLAAGDAVIHRAEESAEWTNPGSAEAQIVSLVVLSDNAIIYPQPDFWQSTGYDVDGPAPIPAGDWGVRLDELQLEPNGAIPAPESPSTHYGVTRADPLAYLAKGMDGQLTLRLADAPTTVYVFTLEWLGESGSSGAPDTASSVADDGVLLDFPLPVEVIPTEARGAAGVRFITVAPDSTSTWEGQVGFPSPGIWVDHILAGSLTMRSQGASEVIRAGGDGSPEAVSAGTEISFGPGDVSIHWMHDSAEWTSGSEEVEIVSLFLFDGTATYPLPAGWTELSYDISGRGLELPVAAYLVRLETMELEQDAALPLTEPSQQFGVAAPGSEAYFATDSAGTMTLRFAEATTTVYVFTLEWLGESATTP